MEQLVTQFRTDHDDFIHDVQFDYYGRRLASCSSDRTIKVFDRDAGGNWTKVSWTAHHGPVWRLSWAHPEYGSVLASCSADHNVCIWEERELVDREEAGVHCNWVHRASLGDSREAVRDAQFAPRLSLESTTLCLASASEDGNFRMYAAKDPTDLALWELLSTVKVVPEGVHALSWCDSRLAERPMVACAGGSNDVVVLVGSTDHTSWQPAVRLTGHTGMVTDVSWAPSMGRSFHTIASSSKDATTRVWRLTPNEQMGDALDLIDPTPGDARQGGEDKAEEGQEAGAAAGGADGAAADNSGTFTLRGCTVLSAAGAQDVWRVQWNVTGSILASSEGDGSVRLWKRTLRGGWRCAASVAGTDGQDSLAHALALRQASGAGGLFPVLAEPGPEAARRLAEEEQAAAAAARADTAAPATAGRAGIFGTLAAAAAVAPAPAAGVAAGRFGGADPLGVAGPFGGGGAGLGGGGLASPDQGVFGGGFP